MELFAVTTGVLLWIHRYRNRRISVNCDNNSVVNMINSSSSKCKNYMVLIRLIIMESMVHNVRVYGRFVRGKKNGIADSLSRLQMDKFKRLTRKRNMDKCETAIPDELWPMDKLWKSD